MTGQNLPPDIGDRVRVRRQRWIVTERRQFDRCAILSLAGIDAANQHADLDVLTPFEAIDRLPASRRIRKVSGARWRRACRGLVARTTGTLLTARTASVDLMPFQLAPALAIVRGEASRLLIADDVGLGKTIQAALVVSELMARGAVERVLVLTPAGLRDQWIAELADRFRIRAFVMDTWTARRLQNQLPIGVNPWSTERVVVASIDYVKRADVAAAVLACSWDVVVVDEAHGIGVNTDRHRVTSALCARAAYVLLLSATPHSGDEDAFRALQQLGAADDPLLIFRRTRTSTGLSHRRRVHRLLVRASPVERQMHARLAAFARAVRREHGGRHPDVALALSVLQKRAFSSAWALECSVRRRLAALEPSHEPEERQLALPLDDPSGELDPSDDTPPWTVPALDDVDRERWLLTRLASTAALAARNETKFSAIGRLLRRLREPVIVFTEFRDTLLRLQHLVAPNAAAIHGGLSRGDRRAALDRFAREGLLLATDAAGEGLNLQATCRTVINLELPWNPMRLEQRIGRVDRIGQVRTVHAFHLIASAGEERMLRRLQERLRRASAGISAGDPLQSADSGEPRAIAASPLDSAAVSECADLALARRLAGDAPSTPHDHLVLANRSRRRSVRRLLGRSAVVLFEWTLTDGSGRAIAARLLAISVRDRVARTWTLAELDAVAERLRGGTIAESCRTEATSRHTRFWRCRLARARTIEGRLSRDTAVLQPGLFDRRALASHQQAASERDRQQDAVDAQVLLAIRALPVAAEAIVPVLILTD